MAFYWLMIAWKDHDTTIFKRGYQLDLVLTILEVGLGVLGILLFPYIFMGKSRPYPDTIDHPYHNLASTPRRQEPLRGSQGYLVT